MPTRQQEKWRSGTGMDDGAGLHKICTIMYASYVHSVCYLKKKKAKGQAARATEQRKYDENDAKCKELGWICVPEAYGAWGTEAMESFSLLASCLQLAPTGLRLRS